MAAVCIFVTNVEFSRYKSSRCLKAFLEKIALFTIFTKPKPMSSISLGIPVVIKHWLRELGTR